ncbi:hypothetical protein COCCADRAFT_109743 [Bipolaris zeicola 26-R-13]|uniref:Uncharacterized protein n=1 Tax=Cochliobolus carbonum (strain 26-R-13) TaxID=930089 RepID=W6XRJ7_COCC2|nr:uncharacterized protein COCCADRAFT_109743 [Bipolaris zeicola 26-R-13]EUC28218.1 hypothetical protein COCCADRAFT_109743 [Bipolaris zeicola 26-R-13]
MIRDPQFWKRFSTAVHQDDLEKQLMTAQSPKHPYVASSSSFTPVPLSLGSPLSQLHFPMSSPGQPPMVHLASLSGSTITSPLSPLSAEISFSDPDDTAKYPAKDKRKSKALRRSTLQKTPSTKPLLRPNFNGSNIKLPPTSTSPSSILSSPTSTICSPDPSPLDPPPRIHHRTSSPSSPFRPFFRAPNISALSLSLSGRPSSRFKFVTTITADASHRDSWLVRQKRKERHRTWICWAFWIGMLLLVAAVVTTVLVLKSRGII